MTAPAYFAIPGDLAARTGGYGYDRAVLARLPLQHLPLPGRYPFPSADDLASADAILADLPDGSVVLVDGLAYGVFDDLAARHAQRLGLIALCHHPLGLETGLAPAASALLLKKETEALRHARAVIVTSPTTADTLVRDLGVPADRITVALPGTDPRAPSPCIGAPPVLLTVGSLIPRKGHDVLIAALDRIRALAWTARFVGGDGLDPAWAARLRSDVAKAGLEDRIAFVGSVEDTAGELSGADVFVLPSRFEGYGMAFAEAMAAGLPVVAVRAGAVPDVVPETAGILVPPEDAAALADALARLLTNRDLFETYRTGSLAAGRALPTWDATAATIAAIVGKGST